MPVGSIENVNDDVPSLRRHDFCGTKLGSERLGKSTLKLAFDLHMQFLDTKGISDLNKPCCDSDLDAEFRPCTSR